MKRLRGAQDASRPVRKPCCHEAAAADHRDLFRRVTQLPSLALIGLVRLYQIFLSPLMGGQCRFYPSCSAYFIEAVRKYGALGGSWRGTLRILRCHPFHPGGYDPP